MKATIKTYTGKMIDLMDPDPELICIEDIAHALSSMNRFNGHTLFPYSVAQHSLHVYKIAPVGLCLQALLHDATEAYLGDIVAPLKKNLNKYQLIEARMWYAITEEFGLPERLDPRVKEADVQALRYEQYWLTNPIHRTPTPNQIRYEHWKTVKKQFLDQFYRLTDPQYKAEQQGRKPLHLTYK